MLVVPAIAASQDGVFTLQQALGAGCSVSAIRAGVARGSLERLLHGVFLAQGAPSPRQRAWAAILRCPHAVISNGSAAHLQGFGTNSEPRIHVIVPPEVRMRTGPRVCVHRVRLARTEVLTREGLVMTTPLRTVMDLGRSLDLGDAVAAADAALFGRHCARDELVSAAELLHGPGAPAARKAMHLAREGAQSPQETHLRLLCRSAGLPEPTLQLRVVLPDGRSAFLDIGWRRAMAGLDFDGRTPHLIAQTFVTDRRRHNALQAVHFDVRIVTGTDLRQRSEACVREWRVMLRERWGCGPADGSEWSDNVAG